MAFEAEPDEPRGTSGPSRDLIDPIYGFLAAMRTRDVGGLVIHLDRQVVWSVQGQPMLKGRDALRIYWGKLFARYRTVRVELRRLVIDGPIRLTEQVHVFDREGEAPFAVGNISVYRVDDSYIAAWNDHFDLSSAPASELAALRRLRDVASVY